jgi:hypothetical protein
VFGPDLLFWCDLCASKRIYEKRKVDRVVVMRIRGYVVIFFAQARKFNLDLGSIDPGVFKQLKYRGMPDGPKIGNAQEWVNFYDKPLVETSKGAIKISQAMTKQEKQFKREFTLACFMRTLNEPGKDKVFERNVFGRSWLTADISDPETVRIGQRQNMQDMFGTTPALMIAPYTADQNTARDKFIENGYAEQIKPLRKKRTYVWPSSSDEVAAQGTSSATVKPEIGVRAKFGCCVGCP